MLNQSEKPVVGALHKSGGADSQKLSVTTKFKVKYAMLTGAQASMLILLILFNLNT